MAKPTKPELWNRIKAKFKRSSKGSKPGEWSARSAQMAAQEYKSRGGGWSGEGGKGNASLKKWGDQKWRTKDGSKARKSDGSTSRYAPDASWRQMSKSEADSDDRKKREASRKGRQFVSRTKRGENTGKKARS